MDITFEKENLFNDWRSGNGMSDKNTNIPSKSSQRIEFSKDYKDVKGEHNIVKYKFKLLNHT